MKYGLYSAYKREAALHARNGDTAQARACLELAKEIEKDIDSIADDKARRIMRLRYIDGWTWTKIAMTDGQTEAAPRNYIARHSEVYSARRRADARQNSSTDNSKAQRTAQP